MAAQGSASSSKCSTEESIRSELEKKRVLKQGFVNSSGDPQVVDFFLGEDIYIGNIRVTLLKNYYCFAKAGNPIMHFNSAFLFTVK